MVPDSHNCTFQLKTRFEPLKGLFYAGGKKIHIIPLENGLMSSSKRESVQKVFAIKGSKINTIMALL